MYHRTSHIKNVALKIFCENAIYFFKIGEKLNREF